MAAQFKSLVNLLMEKRLKRKWGIYQTDERERLGLRLVVPKLEIVVAEPFANVTLGRLLDCSRSESKPEVPIIWSVVPESMTQGSWVARQAMEVPLLNQSRSNIRPNRVGMQRQKATILFLRNRNYLRCWWKWLWRRFFNLKTRLVSRGSTIQLPTKVYSTVWFSPWQ